MKRIVRAVMKTVVDTCYVIRHPVESYQTYQSSFQKPASHKQHKIDLKSMQERTID
ncbi:MAG: hypothetical protein WC533_04670 [Candidatus Pacearchaeota archaeon]